MRTIPILKDDYVKFMEIRKHRPQDTTNADTFNYILRVFEESPIRIEICNELTKPRTTIAGSASSPLMDLDNIRVVTPARLAEELRVEKERRDALRAANQIPNEEKKS